MIRRQLPSASRRTGSVLVAALICLLVASTIVGSMLRANQLTATHLRNQLREVQTRWLAEAAIERAISLVEADEAYSGEIWTVTGDELGHHFDGQVEITLLRDSAGRIEVNVVARCPANGPNFSGSTKTVKFTKDES